MLYINFIAIKSPSGETSNHQHAHHQRVPANRAHHFVCERSVESMGWAHIKSSLLKVPLVVLTNSIPLSGFLGLSSWLIGTPLMVRIGLRFTASPTTLYLRCWAVWTREPSLTIIGSSHQVVRKCANMKIGNREPVACASRGTRFVVGRAVPLTIRSFARVERNEFSLLYRAFHDAFHFSMQRPGHGLLIGVTGITSTV